MLLRYIQLGLAFPDLGQTCKSFCSCLFHRALDIAPQWKQSMYLLQTRIRGYIVHVNNNWVSFSLIGIGIFQVSDCAHTSRCMIPVINKIGIYQHHMRSFVHVCIWRILFWWVCKMCDVEIIDMYTQWNIVCVNLVKRILHLNTWPERSVNGQKCKRDFFYRKLCGNAPH